MQRQSSVTQAFLCAGSSLLLSGHPPTPAGTELQPDPGELPVPRPCQKLPARRADVRQRQPGWRAQLLPEQLQVSSRSPNCFPNSFR